MTSGNDGSSAAAGATDASKTQAEIAQDQWNQYKQLYLPLEQQYVDESQGLGSQANQNKAAQQAGADVESSFAGARAKLNDVPGSNPSSEAYTRAQNDINLAEAADSAASQTAARQNQVTVGQNAEQNALSLGKGLPASSMQGLASASNGLLAAANFGQRSTQYAAGGIARGITGLTDSAAFKNWIGGAGGGSNDESWRTSGNGMPSDYSTSDYSSGG